MKAKFLALFVTAFCTTGLLSAGEFKLTYPSDWTVHRNAGVVVSTAPMTDKNAFIANINVMTDHLGSMSLEEYFAANMKSMEKSVANYRLEGSGSTQINGRDAKWALFHATVEGVSGKVLQYMVKNGKQVVLVTAVDSPDQFDSHRASFEMVASSIKFEREVITPKRDATVPATREKSITPDIKSQKKIFQSAPGDADMPARLYYDK